MGTESYLKLDASGNYQLASSVDSSAGLSSAGRIVALDSTGQISKTMLLETLSIGNLSDAKADETSVYLGKDSGKADTGPHNSNVGVGKDSLRSTVTGVSNVAVGANAALSYTADQMVAVGVYALKDNIVGAHCTAVGYAALSKNVQSDNTALGYNALNRNTEGVGNTATGSFALLSNTTGSENVCFGYYTLGKCTSGSNNTAIGHMAASSVVIGSGNTVLGDKALAKSTGSEGTAVGAHALLNQTTGIQNTALGYKASFTMTFGSSNTSVGWNALLNGVQSNNTAVGSQAMAACVGGTENSGLGAEVLSVGDSPNYNTAVGYRALKTSSAMHNTGIGWYALGQTAEGTQNTALGSNCGTNNINGTDNVIVGFEAMKLTTSSHFNVILGSGAAPSAGDRNVAIGKDSLKAASGGSGNVCIGYEAGGRWSGSDALFIDNTDTTTPLIGGNFSSRYVTINGVLNAVFFQGSGANLTEINSLKIIASEAVLAGSFVNVYSNAGVATLRKAVASDITRQANGFILSDVAEGAFVAVYMSGMNTKLSGLSVGARYFLSDTVEGMVTVTPPAGSGKVIQYLGKALSATRIAFVETPGILIA